MFGGQCQDLAEILALIQAILQVEGLFEPDVAGNRLFDQFIERGSANGLEHFLNLLFAWANVAHYKFIACHIFMRFLFLF
jgi:hypothetical protein